ncbi:unnamed protein product [Prorocentrum cordatum]|uniref:Cilia- and flagella-associated protein 36 n=1 Tax=Prorocentrum cordatum TaxID=2364126 RepID=A0ABN9X0G7_9DINO|nr:unnamed protein product [Polarella glacialis]
MSVGQVYPDLATGENFRAYIQRAMVEDPDEDPLEFGRIAYERFVQIVEMFGAFQDEERMKKEEAARRGTSFSTEEVADFRDLFLATSASGSSLDFEELKRMLRHIMPLGETNVARLQEVVRSCLEASGKQALADAALRDVALDFPEFLWLMQGMVDQDLVGLQRASPRGAQRSPSSASSRRSGARPEKPAPGSTAARRLATTGWSGGASDAGGPGTAPAAA